MRRDKPRCLMVTFFHQGSVPKQGGLYLPLLFGMESEPRNSTHNLKKRSPTLDNILQRYPSAAQPRLHQALQGNPSGETRAEAVRRFLLKRSWQR